MKRFARPRCEAHISSGGLTLGDDVAPAKPDEAVDPPEHIGGSGPGATSEHRRSLSFPDVALGTGKRLFVASTAPTEFEIRRRGPGSLGRMEMTLELVGVTHRRLTRRLSPRKGLGSAQAL